MLLAGDVGGTNVRLALFREVRGRLIMSDLEIYSGKQYPRLEEVLQAYLAKRNVEISGCCIGIAGVAHGGVLEMVNLNWKFNIEDLRRAMGFPFLRFINDLEANAYGLQALEPGDLLELHPGDADPEANRCLISAGTGLGEAGLIRTRGSYLPFHSEGGHTDFSPKNEEEIALLRFLMPEFGVVSFERVVSGPGLVNIYRFLRDTGRGSEPAWLAERLAAEDPAQAISAAGLAGESELCSKALDLLVSLYGSAAGNLAITTLAFGGVYVGGGIAPKILPRIEAGGFLEAFTFKGRLQGFMEKMPVRIVLNDRAALLGSARVAALEHAERLTAARS